MINTASHSGFSWFIKCLRISRKCSRLLTKGNGWNEVCDIRSFNKTLFTLEIQINIYYLIQKLIHAAMRHATNLKIDSKNWMMDFRKSSISEEKI